MAKFVSQRFSSKKSKGLKLAEKAEKEGHGKVTPGGGWKGKDMRGLSKSEEDSRSN